MSAIKFFIIGLVVAIVLISSVVLLSFHKPSNVNTAPYTSVSSSKNTSSFLADFINQMKQLYEEYPNESIFKYYDYDGSNFVVNASTLLSMNVINSSVIIINGKPYYYLVINTSPPPGGYLVNYTFRDFIIEYSEGIMPTTSPNITYVTQSLGFNVWYKNGTLSTSFGFIDWIPPKYMIKIMAKSEPQITIIYMSIKDASQYIFLIVTPVNQ